MSKATTTKALSVLLRDFRKSKQQNINTKFAQSIFEQTYEKARGLENALVI